MTAIPVIVNATSGPGREEERLQALVEAFREQGIEARVLAARDGGQLTERLDEALAQGSRLVVVGGGDGTLGTAASSLRYSGTALGILPLGTRNHFARDLGIPLDVREAIGVIARGRRIAVDLGEVNGKAFINNSSIGIYPDIVRDRTRQQRRLGRGKRWALFWATLTALRRSPFLHVEVTIEGQARQYRTPFVFIGNNEYVMEGFDIGRRAALQDAKLAVYATRRHTRVGLLRLGLRALFGRLRQARDFEIVTTSSVDVATRHRFLRVAADGEVFLMQTPLRYRIRPGALEVVVP